MLQFFNRQSCCYVWKVLHFPQGDVPRNDTSKHKLYTIHYQSASVHVAFWHAININASQAGRQTVSECTVM